MFNTAQIIIGDDITKGSRVLTKGQLLLANTMHPEVNLWKYEDKPAMHITFADKSTLLHLL